MPVDDSSENGQTQRGKGPGGGFIASNRNKVIIGIVVACIILAVFIAWD